MAIHVFPPDSYDDHWQVWTDCEDDTDHDGRCIGVGKTREEALLDAFAELTSDTIEVGDELGMPVRNWPANVGVEAWIKRRQEAAERAARATGRFRGIRVREEV